LHSRGSATPRVSFPTACKWTQAPHRCALHWIEVDAASTAGDSSQLHAVAPGGIVDRAITDADLGASHSAFGGRGGAMRLARRDVQDEIQRPFLGSPAERILLAQRLGKRCIAIFLAAQPPGMRLDEARRILARNKTRGRRPSKLMDARDA
jgi:hypothetical protein